MSCLFGNILLEHRPGNVNPAGVRMDTPSIRRCLPAVQCIPVSSLSALDTEILLITTLAFPRMILSLTSWFPSSFRRRSLPETTVGFYNFNRRELVVCAFLWNSEDVQIIDWIGGNATEQLKPSVIVDRPFSYMTSLSRRLVDYFIDFLAISLLDNSPALLKRR